MKSKLFKKVSAISIALCMALSASAVAIAGWTDDVYTPTFDTQTTVYNWSDAYGADGYILLGDGTNGAVIYSDLYQDSAYATDATGATITSTKGTTNKILGGLSMDAFNHYKGYYYTYAQADLALEVVKANGGTSLAGETYKTQIKADASAWADILDSDGEGGLRADAPISTWGVSGSTWSNASGHTQWRISSGDIVNVRVQAGNVAYPYTIAFTITEDAVAEGGIYVTVRTDKMTSGDVRLVEKLFLHNDAAAIADNVTVLQQVGVTGNGFVTFYIETAGDYTIVANDTTAQEGITGIFFDKTEPIPVAPAVYSSTYTTTGSDWESVYGNAGYFIAAHDGTTQGAYIGGLVDGVDGDVITACANGNILSTSNWNGPLAGMSYSSASWQSNAATMSAAPYAPGTTNKVLGRIHSNDEVETKGTNNEQGGAVGFNVSKANFDRAEAVTGERAIYVTVLESQWNKVTATTNFTSKLYYSGVATNIITTGYVQFYTYTNYYKQNTLVTTHTDTLDTTKGIYVTYKITAEGYYAITMNKDVGRQVGLQALFVDYVNPVDNFAGDITVDLAGGSLAEGDSIPATYNPLTMTEDIVLPTPVRKGFTFVGWSVNGADPVASYTITSQNIGDLDLVAKWDYKVYDGNTKSAWEGTYGDAGYIIYAGESATTRKIYHKNIFAGDSEGAYSQLSPFDLCNKEGCSCNGTTEAMHRDFRVNSADPDGTIISAFGDQTYLTRGDKTSGAGLYIPGTTTVNQFMPKSSSYAMQSAVAFYVPESALATAKGISGNSEIFVSLYIPGETANRNAGDTVTTNFFYSDSDNLDNLLSGSTYDDIHGSTTNSAVGILKASLKKDSQVYTYSEGETNGVYMTILISEAGYYALQVLDSEDRGTWQGVFFDYFAPEKAKTLTVDKADGSEPTVTEFKSYSSDITLETPSRVGYTFAGWSVDGAEAVLEYTLDCSEATVDVSVVATWTPNVYNINTNLNGGEATIPATYTIESDAIVLPTPVKAGYDFAGWKVNGAAAVMEYTIASGSTGDIDLVATWVVHKNTITYVAGDYGTLDSTTQLIGVGEDYALYIPTITDITKVFAGWKIESTDEIIATTGVWTIDGDVTLVAVYNDVQLAVSTDGSTGANWEGAYGNAGYIIYAGDSTTDRYIYHKGIYAGYDESAYSQLSPFDTCTNEADCTQEAMHRDFRVNGADPSGTIISAFGDQTYYVKDNTVSSDGLYIPGSLTLNKYFTRSSNAGATAQTAVAFYVPETALTTSTTGTIYVSMYLPGEAATRNAGDSVTAHLFYSNSDNLDTLLGRSTYDDQHGSTTNSATGILNASKKVASQTHAFAEGDPNGVYMTFAINAPGYYAIQGADSEARVGWSGIFFDYERPVPNVSATSHVSTVKYGDADFDADRIGRYGDDYYLIAATADETDSNRKTGAVDSNMYTPDAYVDGLVPVTGTSAVGGVTGLLNPLTGGFRTDIPVRNVYVNTYIRSITSPYGVALADGTQSNSLFKGNGTGIAGFTFEVYTNETIYVTAYFAQEKEYLVDGTTPYTFDIDVNLYKNTAFFESAPANVPSNSNFPKVAKLLQTVEVNGMNGAYVTFAISGKGIYFLAEDFTQYTAGGNLQVAPQALYVSTSEPVAKNALTVDLAGGEATLDLPKYFDATTADITLPTPVKAGYDFAGWSVNGAPAVMEYTLDCSEATADVSVVATWTPTVYNINVNLNGGEATIPATYTIEDTIVIPAPEKANYVFVGWLVNGAEDAVDSYTIASGSTGDISLVAVWTGVTYTITYDANGGTVSSATQSVVYGGEYSLLIPTHSDVTKVFGGWQIVDGDEIASTGFWTMGDVSLVAIWNDLEIETKTDTTTYAMSDWYNVYGKDGYVLIGAGTDTSARVVYSDLYVDEAYTTGLAGTTIESTKGTTNKIYGGIIQNNFEYAHYVGGYYTLAQADVLWDYLVAMADVYSYTGTLTNTTERFASGTYTVPAEGGVANAYINTSDNSLRLRNTLYNNRTNTALVVGDKTFNVPQLLSALNNTSYFADSSPISRFSVSGSTWKDSSVHNWQLEDGSTVGLDIRNSDDGKPYTISFTIKESALANGPIYVTSYVAGVNTEVNVKLRSGYITTAPANDDALAQYTLLGATTIDANGFISFEIKNPGDYILEAYENLPDGYEKGKYRTGLYGLFFDSELYDIDHTVVSTKVGDPNAYAYYGADAWFYVANTESNKLGGYMVSSGIIKDKTTGEMVDGEQVNLLNTDTGNGGTIAFGLADPDTYAFDGMITRLGAVASTFRPKDAADWNPIHPDGSNIAAQIGGGGATQNGGWAFTLDADAFVGHDAIYVTVADTLNWDNPETSYTYNAQLYEGYYLALGTYNPYTNSAVKMIASTAIADVENNQAVYVTFKITAPGTYTYNAITGVDRPSTSAIYFDYEEPNLEATRSVSVNADAGANVNAPEFITVGEAAETFTVAANGGYKLSTITVAGVEVEITDPATMTVTLPVVTASLKGALNIAVTTEEVTVAEIESYLLVNGTLYVTASTLAVADEFGIEWDGTKYPADKTKGEFFYTAIAGVGAGENTFRPYMTVGGSTLYGANITETLVETDGKTHTPDVSTSVFFGDYTDAEEVTHENTLFIIGEINGVAFGSAEIVEVGVTFSLWNGTAKEITRVLDVDQEKLADYTISDKNFGFAILNMDTAYSINSFKVFIKYADETVVESAAYDIEFVDGNYVISLAD